MLRYGIVRERLATLITDTSRALLLEAVGYKTDMAEFIGEIPFENIAPGEKTELRFNFPEMVEKEIIPMTANKAMSII